MLSVLSNAHCSRTTPANPAEPMHARTQQCTPPVQGQLPCGRRRRSNVALAHACRHVCAALIDWRIWRCICDTVGGTRPRAAGLDSTQRNRRRLFGAPARRTAAPSCSCEGSQTGRMRDHCKHPASARPRPAAEHTLAVQYERAGNRRGVAATAGRVPRLVTEHYHGCPAKHRRLRHPSGPQGAVRHGTAAAASAGAGGSATGGPHRGGAAPRAHGTPAAAASPGQIVQGRRRPPVPRPPVGPAVDQLPVPPRSLCLQAAEPDEGDSWSWSQVRRKTGRSLAPPLKWASMSAPLARRTGAPLAV